MVQLGPDCAVVVQRLPDPATARRAVDNARLLAEARLPGPSSVGPARGRYVAWSRSTGTPGPLLLGGPQGSRLAHHMGRLARELGQLPTSSVASDPAWRSPADLRSAATEWLEQLAAEEEAVRERRAAIWLCVQRASAATWSPRPTHGDFVPANVLVRAGRIEALLDVTDLALRHPDVDAAWWELVVGFHHPAEAARLATSLRRGYAARDQELARPLRDVAAVRALQLAALAGPAGRSHAVALLAAASDARDT
jgi:aminoglycoside phosphotransferase (APT) family kinase protein